MTEDGAGEGEEGAGEGGRRGDVTGRTGGASSSDDEDVDDGRGSGAG